MKLFILLLSAVVVLNSCSSSSNSGAAGEDTLPALTLNAQFKGPLLKLVEGTYSNNCTRTINNQAAAGLPITISTDGIISWGDVTDDLTKLNSSTFSMSRNYALNTFVAQIETRNVTTGNRVTAYEIRVDTNGKVTASLTHHSTKTVIACEKSTAPAAISTSFWNEALKYITVNETNIECTDSATSSTTTGVASMTATEAKALNKTVLKSDVSTESIFVYDENAGFPAGLIYHVYTTSGIYATLAITSQKKFNSLQIDNPNTTKITCKTPTATVP